jgi:very-short-patch-repair endonuclease
VARSLLDAAAWMGTNDQARAVLAAGVQQRIVRVEDLMTVIRLDAAGRRRWLDAYWDRARLVVEVDGMWHMEAAAWWADMRRDNDLTAAGVWGELARGSTA